MTRIAMSSVRSGVFALASGLAGCRGSQTEEVHDAVPMLLPECPFDYRNKLKPARSKIAEVEVVDGSVLQAQ